MAKDKGWVKAERIILDTAIWNNGEPFDERSAYFDLKLRANYQDSIFRPRKGTEPITVKAGELFTSIGMLSERWKWSENKVRRYLKMLKKIGFLNYRRHPYGTLITLENIEVEDDERHPCGTPNGRSGGRSGGTPDGRSGGTRLKKDKNRQEDKELKKGLKPGLKSLWENPE